MNAFDSDYPERVDSAYPTSEAFNRSLLRAIQEASPDGILVVDECGAVVTYNQRFLEVWRIPSERVQPDDDRGGTVLDNPILLTATQQVKDSEGFLQRVNALYADPCARDHCEIELKDGRTLERHSVGLRSEGGHYLGRVWFFRDITEHKETEAALQGLAWRDPLTGLLNRRHFFERATEELMRARRYGHPLAVLMLDLDHFKNINDQYGHAAGDRVLQVVSERLGGQLRNVDLLARIGGEEFVVLMPDSDLEEARVVAERLCASISDQGIPAEGHEIFCTVSAGVAIVRALVDSSIEDAIKRADKALYRAKDRGRNRVETESQANGSP